MSATTKQRTPAADPRRHGFKWSVAAGLTVLVLSALFISTTRATSQVAGDGIGLGRAEAALGANDLALKALGQAVLLAEDNAFGVADETTLRLAIAEATATLSELEARASELELEVGATAESAALTATALEDGRAVIGLIVSGKIDDAGAALSSDAITSFESLRDHLSIVREDQELALTSTGATANRLGDVVTFLVVFLLPLLAVLAYRYAARRQLHSAEIQLDARLDAEREVMRAKDEFIGNISHELRTPLTSIFGFSELLLESGAVDPAATLDLVGLINYESSELTRMVEDLLVSARLEANALAYKYEKVDVSSELDSVIASMRYNGPEIESLLTAVACWGDPVRVRQILRNLLSNAQRYGGSRIRVTSRPRDDMLELVVADDGPGVVAEMEPRLFTRFVHGGHEALMAGSVGLGLSVVGSLVEAMGGSVSYEHRDGWARFVVLLPVAATAGTPVAVDPLEEQSAVQATYLRNWLGERRDDQPVTQARNGR